MYILHSFWCSVNTFYAYFGVTYIDFAPISVYSIYKDKEYSHTNKSLFWKERLIHKR